VELIIEESVGQPFADGTPSPNNFADVLIVQFLLNQVTGDGRPAPPLPLDGLATREFEGAIRVFQEEALANPSPNGRIDPGDEAMAALNLIALSSFEGVDDRLEQLSIILRPFHEWNFTRGDFKSLTEFAGLKLRFDDTSFWLPDPLKRRLLVAFNALLDPSAPNAPTWGVHPFDWYHCHLSVWSGELNVRISDESEQWVRLAQQLGRDMNTFRAPFTIDGHDIPESNIEAYRRAYPARMAQRDVADVLETYATLPQAVIVHHTFEGVAWRPDMQSDDERRNWMVTPDEDLQTAPYRSNTELDAADARLEFICEGAIQVDFLINTIGIVKPVLASYRDLSIVTGLPSVALLPPAGPVFPATADPIRPPYGVAGV
jgi:hypothetical protein